MDMDKNTLIKQIRRDVGDVISHWTGAHQAWAYLQLHGWGYRQQTAYGDFMESVDRQLRAKGDEEWRKNNP